MQTPKLQLQSLGETPQLHNLPSPSRRRLRGKSESPEKRGSTARVSDPSAVYDEAETALEEARNQCSELQDKIARFQEEMQLERSAWRKRVEKRARGMQPEEDEDECSAGQGDVPTEQTEDAEVEQRQDAELCGEGELTLRLPAEAAEPVPCSEAEPQPDESVPIVKHKRKSRKQRQQSSDSNEIEPHSRRRARRHSEPAVETRRPSVPGLVAEDDVVSPTGEEFVKSLGRRFHQPDPVVTKQHQPERRRRHSAPPTPEQMADLDAELNAAEPRRGMLAKILNFLTPQWMREDCAVDYAQMRRSQSRRRSERRSQQAGHSGERASTASERLAVYASQR